MSLRNFKKNLAALAFAAAVTCGAATSVNAQSTLPPEEKNWKEICAQALAQPHKPPSFSHPRSGNQLQNCDSEELYYGFSGSPDPSAALQCAYYQRAHPDPANGDPFAGPGVLTMLYANGKGVRRNYRLAIRFACENSWAAEAEMELRIGHLEQLRDSGNTAKFDLCDDATSGLMQGACESVQQKFADVKRQRRIEAISGGWSRKLKKAFKSLQKAEEEFENTRVGKEVDLSGSGRAAFALQEQGRLRDQFLINLKRFAKGDIPDAPLADGRTLDQELDQVYRHIQQSPESSWQYGTIKPSGIRDTERAWLKLRTAWTEFSGLAYPGLNATRIATQLTRLRLHQLESLARRH